MHKTQFECRYCVSECHKQQKSAPYLHPGQVTASGADNANKKDDVIWQRTTCGLEGHLACFGEVVPHDIARVSLLVLILIAKLSIHLGKGRDQEYVKKEANFFSELNERQPKCFCMSTNENTAPASNFAPHQTKSFLEGRVWGTRQFWLSPCFVGFLIHSCSGFPLIRACLAFVGCGLMVPSVDQHHFLLLASSLHWISDAAFWFCWNVNFVC